MRHSTEHPLPWGEDEGPREKCQLSSSTLQEHMWDRSSLTTPRHMPRSSRASIHNRRMLLKIPRNRQFQEPLLLLCQRPPSAIWPVTICSMAFNEFFMKEPSPPWEGHQGQSRPLPTFQPFQTFLVLNASTLFISQLQKTRYPAGDITWIISNSCLASRAPKMQEVSQCHRAVTGDAAEGQPMSTPAATVSGSASYSADARR